MINLESFIKIDFLKEEMKKNSTVVTSFQEADAFALDVSQGKMTNVVFETTALKTYCFTKIKDMCEVNIINCNSNLERFCESSVNKGITIFDNINSCRNLDILSMVVNRKGILVC